MFNKFKELATSVTSETKSLSGLEAKEIPLNPKEKIRSFGLSSLKSGSSLIAKNLSSISDSALETATSVKDISLSANSSLLNSVTDVGSTIAEKGKKAGTSASIATSEAKDTASKYITDNGRAIKKKVESTLGVKGSEIAVSLAKKATVGLICGQIAAIVYVMLPFPVRWVVSENDLSDFMEDNVELLIEILN